MKRVLLPILHGMLLVLAAAARGATTPPDPDHTPLTDRELAQGYREHVILARPHPARRATLEAEEAREGMRIRRTFPRFRDLRIIELDSFDAAETAIARLRATGRYELVEPDYIRTIALEPNDPQFTNGALWGLKNPGQASQNGVLGADIEATAAWDIIREAPNVIVAVIDTGVNINHVDLAGNIWTNPSPTRGDLHGANFVGGRGSIVSGNPADDNGHGTHVAGTIGAVGNNGIAVAGVAWRVKLMPLKVFPASGSGSVSDIVPAIHYAVDHGAHIINASYGALSSNQFSGAERGAIEAARAAGVIFVAAAGNSAANMDVSRFYPASHALDNIVSVGNSTNRDELSLSSNYGSAVDLFAPGSDIISLIHSNNTGVATKSGTSMAAPHVSGTLALLKARFPTDNYRQLINRLMRGAEPSVNVDPKYSFVGISHTGGRLNAWRALTTTNNRPFNDDFASRPRFANDNLTLRTSNAGATAEAGEFAHAGASATASLWWEWTAPSNGSVSVTTTGSSYDTVLAVYTGNSPGALSPVTANDNDGGNTTSRLSFTAQAGATYQIAVDGKNGASGLTLVELGTTPSNDAFATPIVLTGGSTRVSGANANSSREPGEPRIPGYAYTGGRSLWYRWTAPRTGSFQVAAVSTDFDPLLAAYTGSILTALTRVDSNDDASSSTVHTGSLCTIDAVAGTNYMLTVDSKDASTVGAFTLTVTDSRWQSPVGDAITGAPAVGSDGTIYFGSIDGSVYALSTDGSIRWSVETDGLIDTCSPAIADDGTVYIGSNDGRIYAINPNGQTKWTRNPANSSPMSNSPALGADGTIYVKAGDGFLYALNPANGSPKWRYDINGPTTYASPSVAPDGTIYQGSDDKKLYAINPDGSLKWVFEHGDSSDIYTVPAIDASGNIYFSVLNTGTLISITPAGALRWIYRGAATGSSSAACLSPDGGTVYFGGYDRKLHAVNTATGAARWAHPLGDEVRASSPAVDANGVIYIGCYDYKLYAINPDGTLHRTWDTGDWIRSSPAIHGHTLYVGSNDGKLYAFDIGAGAGTGPWPQYRHNVRRTGRALPAVSFSTQPSGGSVAAGASITFSAAATGSPTPLYQWRRNGADLIGATGSSHTVTNMQPANAGVYTVIASGSSVAESSPAILGFRLDGTTKLAGSGTEVGSNIEHPNGNIYDQFLLEGAAITVRADSDSDPAEALRLSYIDLNDDIVQVEFSGAGTLTLVLDGESGPAAPINFNQPDVTYMKGHASIIVSGANETTHLTVFTVGRLTAFDRESDQGGFNFMKPISPANDPANNRSPLFEGHASTGYDGIADIGFIAILSDNGKFGGLRTANASYFGTRGITGIHAPGVQFTGDIYIGDLSAFEECTPVLIIGSAPQTSVHGGSLLQANDRAVQVSGISQLRFLDGTDSHNRFQPAQENRARLEQNGTDVTSQIAVAPAP